MYLRSLTAIIFVFFLSACSPDINKKTYHYNFETTLGQEIIDLKKALEQGAISEEDYDEMVDSLKKSRFSSK